MREIVFDTETTGLDPSGGDRVVEIGCLELINHIPSGRTFHRYVNPGRPVSVDAVQVHGLDDAFLKDKPAFAAIAVELVDFFGDCPLIAHNAEFDLGFVNAELGRCGHPPIAAVRMVDSLMLARRKHPGGPNSLDGLCARYQIDTSRRTFHGALLDAQLLAEVYVELIGGRQASLILGTEIEAPSIAMAGAVLGVRQRPQPRTFRVSEAELVAHRQRIAALVPEAIWQRYFKAAPAEAAAS